MPLFHCPAGALFYEGEGCIRCRLCLARTREEAVEASRKIREFLNTRARERQERFLIRKIAVCGKGGVGKSTIVALLAEVLMDFGYRVLVLDTDESNPGLFRMLGLEREPRPLLELFSSFLTGRTGVPAEWLAREEVRMEDIPSEFLVQKGNLKFMMVGKIEESFQGCACAMADLTRDLMLKIAVQHGEIVLADHEAGVESFGRGVERGVDTVLSIVEPSFASFALTERIRYMAEGLGIGRFRVILNRIPSEDVEETMVESLAEKEIKYLGAVYTDPQVSEAHFLGQPIGESKAKEQMGRIARLMLDEAEMKYQNRLKTNWTP